MTSARPLFLDLDGPILDVRRRYHSVHADILAALGVREDPLDLAAFWEDKRAGASGRALCAAHYPEVDAVEYGARWIAEIEAPERLLLDEVWTTARAALERLRASGPLVIVTLRQHGERVTGELARLGVEVDRVLHASPLDGPGWNSKERLLRTERAREGDWIVGDTEVDIRAGKALGMRTCGVTCGIRNAGLLAAEGPEHLVEDLAAFANLVL